MNRTPHCTGFCRQAKDGTVWHVHGNAKRKRFRKRKCRCDMCSKNRARRLEPIDDRD